MELSIARLVYERAEPPKDIQTVLQQATVNLPSKFAQSAQSLNQVESAIEREGFMVQVMA